MKRIFSLIIDLFRFHKLKMLLVLLTAGFFLLILFPFSDLTDLMTGKILEATNNRVFIQADKLDLSVLPTVNLDGQNVVVDISSLPAPLTAKRIAISPSVLSLLGLAFKANPAFMSVSLDADGLFGGNVSLSQRPNGSNDEGAKKNHLSLKAENIQLHELDRLADSPVSLIGKANLTSEVDFFPLMDGQPEGQVTLTSKGLKIPAGTVPTQFGPLGLPGVNLSAVNVKAHMASSTLILDEVSLGSPKDPISGRAKGQMNLKVDKGGVIPGAYDIRIELNLSVAAERELKSFMVFIEKFRQPGPAGARYLFRLSATGPGTPAFDPTSTF